MRPLAYDVVNRLRGYLEADRVALGICRGKKCEIKGISNQAVFDRRSNVLRKMEKLATQIARTEESFHYPLAGQEIPPVLSTSAEKFLEVANARTYDGLFLMPLWRTLGNFADFYRGHTQRKALLITSMIAAVILALVFVPAEFKVRGEGKIQPVVRQHVYAESEGTIDQLLVVDGASVRKGDLLMKLRNPEVTARFADIEGRLREAEAQFQTVTIQRVSRAYSNEQEERDLVRTASTAEAKIISLREQLELIGKSLQQLEIRSPLDGQVITWDVQQKLRDRPVKPGQRLLTVAVESDAWEVELRIPDKRAGYLLKEWRTCELAARPMLASFVLTSNSSHTHFAKVVEVSPGSDVDDKENENVVRVKLDIANDAFSQIGDPKPGTSVTGHIHCGTAPIGYCKLYEFFDWVHRIWFQFVA